MSQSQTKIDHTQAGGKGFARRRILALLIVGAVCLATMAAVAPRKGMEVRFCDIAHPDCAAEEALGSFIEPPPIERRFADSQKLNVRPPYAVHYEGLLRIRRPGAYFFYIDAQGPATIRLGDREIVSVDGGGVQQNSGYVQDIDAGLHRLEIDFEDSKEVSAQRPQLTVGWSREVAIETSISPDIVFRPDTGAWRWIAARGLRIVALGVLLALIAEFVRGFVAPARFRRLAFGGAAAALAGLLFCILAEIALRLAGLGPREYVPGSLAHYDFRPGVITQYEGWIPYNIKEFEVPIAINEAGWRDRDYALQKPEGVYRILIIGDSYVLGMEVELEKTFHKRLEALLNEKSGPSAPRYEVMAMAKSGSGPVEQARILRRAGMAYDPDLILVSFYEGNDIQESWPALSQQYLDWSLRVYRNNLIPAKIAFLDRWVRVERSYLNHFIADRLCEIYVSQYHLFSADISREDMRPKDFEIYRAGEDDTEWAAAWKAVLKSLEEMDELARSKGADFFMMLVHSDQAQSMNRDRTGAREGLDLDMPRRRLRDFSRESGIEIFDLKPALEGFEETTGRRYTWNYDGHWNEEGHRVVAEALFEYLAPRIEESRVGSPGDSKSGLR